jgi:nitric oxide reductase activation protein
VLQAYPALASRRLQPLGFLSDFLFPVSFSDPPSDRVIADLKQAAGKQRQRQGDAIPSVAGKDEHRAAPGDRAEDTAATTDAAVFVYDEWDFQQQDFRPGWCHVRQKPVPPAPCPQGRNAWLDEARRVRALFERLKPDLARREKHLLDGDDINADLLVHHMVNRRHEPSPPARFYEKPTIKHRDLAVLVLMDVSGSTGEQLGTAARILDIEKQAAVILGQGLAALGDRFAVCGFSSNGREQCEYFRFKDFADPWSTEAISRIMAATPRSSTRIGPALRHSGYLLSRESARQRLIVLVTDGKPMDQGYDPHTRYAQHDVRMACEENARQEIHTFAISTEENSLADMEIMFPRRRFVILPSIAYLPRVLPALYLRLTLSGG